MSVAPTGGGSDEKTQKQSLYQRKNCPDHRHQYVEDENGYLFVQGTYPTKIKAGYVYGRYYKYFGYLSAKGVVDMKYVPSKYSDHFLKDDFLFISYNTPISENPEASSIIDSYTGYDERITRSVIVKFLRAASQYSEYETSNIERQIKEKADLLGVTMI